MIENPWFFLALLTTVAGTVLTLGELTGRRFFAIVPPIVVIYILVSILAGIGLWRSNDAITTAQSLSLNHLLPPTLFLMLCQCSVRGIWKLGPRILLALACATLSIIVSFIVVYYFLHTSIWHIVSTTSICSLPV
jgi:uncharacterized membrane protein